MAVLDLEEKRLEKLPPRELARQLMRLPARRRLEVVLQRTDAAEVVEALPVQDFYFFLQEIGPDDALPLLALAQVDQLNHLFDLEWWQKETVHPAKALGWLERLERASEEKLVLWLYYADFSLLLTLFKKWLTVGIPPTDIDLAEAREELPKNSLDDYFFWEMRYPQYEDFVRRVLSFLFEVNHSFYQELMDHILWAVDVEVEEDAYRFHSGRLEDNSFPDYYDALEIYRAMRLEDVVAGGKPPALVLPEEAVPGFALAMVPDGDLLGSALREIQDQDLMSSLQLELASLANKVVTADRLPLDNPDALRQAVEKSVAYVNLGLDLASGGELRRAAELVREAFLEHLFRVAQADVAGVRNRLRSLQKQGWLSRWPKGVKILDSYWLERAELLLGKTPRLLRAPSSAAAPPREDFFRTRRDLEEARRFVEAIENAGALFDSLQVKPEALERELWADGQIPDVESVTLGVLVWTAAARFISRGEWEAEPLSRKAWASLFPLLGTDAMERTLRSKVNEIVPDVPKGSSAWLYLHPLLLAYDEEMAAFPPGDPPEPALVKHFLFASDEK